MAQTLSSNVGLVQGETIGAARGTTTVIGSMMKNLRAGEQTLLSRLPNRGIP